MAVHNALVGRPQCPNLRLRWPNNFAKLEENTHYHLSTPSPINQSVTMAYWCPLCPRLRPDEPRQKNNIRIAGMLCNICYFLLTNDRINCKKRHGLDDDEIDENVQKHEVGRAEAAARNQKSYDDRKKNNPDAYVQSSFQPILHFLKLLCGLTC